MEEKERYTNFANGKEGEAMWVKPKALWKMAVDLAMTVLLFCLMSMDIILPSLSA